MTTTAVQDGAATIRAAAHLRGEVALPGDKSISHRALLLGAIAEGESRIDGASDGADVRSTAAILRALGVSVEASVWTDGRTSFHVRSGGIDTFREPAATLDCGNSGTTLRLTAGILAGVPVRATLDGDDSLRGRPVARIIEPLRAMGAELHGRDDDSRPPVEVSGRSPLRAIDWRTPVPSAQVKSAILLAGLRAAGTTTVREAVATRDHTERMLRARGVTVRTTPMPDGGRAVAIEGGATVRAIDVRVPADPSAAAFWLVAGAIHPDAELRLATVGVNPTRRAAIDLLREMGAEIAETPAGDSPVDASPDDCELGEPVADLVVRSSALRGIDVDAARTAAAIDEVPVLCVAATQARGRTRIRGAGELRVKESDRIAGIVAGLRALGAEITVDGDDLVIDGPATLHGAAVESRGDHRLAMAFAIAGLVSSGETRIDDAASAAISDPRFFVGLEAVRA